jgi:hypothetical protein
MTMMMMMAASSVVVDTHVALGGARESPSAGG